MKIQLACIIVHIGPQKLHGVMWQSSFDLAQAEQAFLAEKHLMTAFTCIDVEFIIFSDGGVLVCPRFPAFLVGGRLNGIRPTFGLYRGW